jgi:hypothetical protein
VSEPINPAAFDPRRLAGLSPRPTPAPGPAAAGLAPRSLMDEVGSWAGAGDSGGPTGHPQVDAVLSELERAEQLPPDQQIAVYESVHRTLQETLRSIEQN